MVKHQVFLSSPIKGVEDLRDEIVNFLETEMKLDVISYGYPQRGPTKPGLDPIETCIFGLEKCNSILLIVVRRYGDLKDFSKKYKKISSTELEYLIGLKIGIKPIVFCREEVWILFNNWVKELTKEIKKNDKRYDNPLKLISFLKKIKTKYNISTFKTSVDLKEKLRNVIFIEPSKEYEAKIEKV